MEPHKYTNHNSRLNELKNIGPADGIQIHRLATIVLGCIESGTTTEHVIRAADGWVMGPWRDGYTVAVRTCDDEQNFTLRRVFELAIENDLYLHIMQRPTALNAVFGKGNALQTAVGLLFHTDLLADATQEARKQGVPVYCDHRLIVEMQTSRLSPCATLPQDYSLN